MSVIEIKQEIHQLVEQIDDSDYLQDIHNCIAFFLGQKKDVVDNLSELQISQIHQSLEEVKNGFFFTNDQVKKEAKEWLIK